MPVGFRLALGALRCFLPVPPATFAPNGNASASNFTFLATGGSLFSFPRSFRRSLRPPPSGRPSSRYERRRRRALEERSKVLRGVNLAVTADGQLDLQSYKGVGAARRARL